MITELDDYFIKGCGRCARFDTPDCSIVPWGKGLEELDRLCRNVGLDPALKWAHPCYLHAGRNIAMLGAFRGDFRLSFFNAALMKDPEAVLERAGPNTKHAHMIRFTANEQVAAMEPIITAYLKEAMGYAAAGLKAPPDDSELEIPEELTEALDSDSELAEAFHALTPGRRKSYVINLSSAKQSATRVKRIAGFRDKILAGKGATDR